MARAVVVINPVSGRGRLPSRIDARGALAREVLAVHGFDVSVQPTKQSGDAHLFAREAVRTRADLVVVWGGDGTVNEVASALVHTPVPMVIVPAGSGNGLAADLRIPFEPRAALTLAATGTTIAIDAGTVDERYFFNIAGIGIDAVIAAQFARRPRHQRGFVGYLQLSSAELMRYRCQSYTLSLDDRTVEHRAMLIALANGRQYGNRLLIAPGARLDDGLLEVVIVEQLSLIGIAWRLPSLFRGTLRPGRGVTMRAARTLRIASSAPIPYHVDGEPQLGTEALNVQTHERALRVRAAPIAANAARVTTPTPFS
jgi:YegS/Rv2252/BmrU family lipid kinase